MRKLLIFILILVAAAMYAKKYMKDAAGEELVIGTFKRGFPSEMKAGNVDLISWNVQSKGKELSVKGKANISYRNDGVDYCKIVEIADKGNLGVGQRPDVFKVIGDCL